MTWESKIPLAELMVGETPRWTRGVCEIVAKRCGEPVPGGLQRTPSEIWVYGENDHPIERIPLRGNDLDVEDIDRIIAEAIDREMGAL